MSHNQLLIAYSSYKIRRVWKKLCHEDKKSSWRQSEVFSISQMQRTTPSIEAELNQIRPNSVTIDVISNDKPIEKITICWKNEYYGQPVIQVVLLTTYYY